MALPAATQWEVRSTGSDTACGGGFVAGASGTDYSQQDAAQSSGTDLVVDATTNTKVTSASHNFVATDVGNLIQITAGSGWTTGFYQVVSVASNAATLDRSPAATSTTGGTWALGGGLLTLPKAIGAWVDSNIIWVKKGTFTITAEIDLNGTNSPATKSPNMILGYQTTHGDNPTGSNRPTLSFTAAVKGLCPISGLDNLIIANLIVDGTATGTIGFYTSFAGGPYYGMTLVNVRFTRWTDIGMYTDGGSGFPTCIGCEIDGMTSGARGGVYAGVNGGCTFFDSEIHDNACHGVNFDSNANGQGRFLRVNCYRNTGTTGGVASAGFFLRSCRFNSQMESCIAYGNAGQGLDNAGTYAALSVRNCIFSQNGTYGQNVIAQNVARPDNDYNFYYSNTSGARNGLVAGAHDVTLTANPFTNVSLSANGAADFSLNTTAGGGAAVRAAGYPGVSPSGNSTGHLDGGAYQHADPSAALSPALIQSKKNSSGTGTTTVTWNTPTTAGSLLVAWVTGQTDGLANIVPALPAGSGWTQADNGASAKIGGKIFYWANAPSQSSQVFTSANNSDAIAAFVMEFAGGVLTSAFDVAHENNATSGTALTTGSTATTAQASEIWVAGVGTDAGGFGTGATFSAPLNGFTVADTVTAQGTGGSNNGVISGQSLYKIVNGISTASSGATANGSGNWQANVATFEANAQAAASVFVITKHVNVISEDIEISY